MGVSDAYEHKVNVADPGLSGPVFESTSLNLPQWALHVPEHSFVGISPPASCIEAARQQAVESAIHQILQAMGAEYLLIHESRLTGNLHKSSYKLEERLSYTAKWLLNSVHRNVAQYAFQSTGNGYICFVLIRMTPSDLKDAKRLSVGAKVSARLIGISGVQAVIDVSETNGVGVTMTEYRITAAIKNNHARLITLFFRKVPEAEIAHDDGCLSSRLSLKKSSGRTSIPVVKERGLLKSFLMGAEERISITITGYDEIGRPVSAFLNVY